MVAHAAPLGQGRRRLCCHSAVAVLLPYIPDVPVLSTIFDTPDSDFASVLFYPVGCYVLVAIGLNIVVGQAGLLDLGYVAFFAVGAYTTAVLGSAHATLPWLLTVPIGVGVAMTAGVLLGLPTLRLRGDYLAIVTLGFGEIIRITAHNTDWLGGPRGIQNIPKPPSWFGLHFGVLDAKPYYWLVLRCHRARDLRLQAPRAQPGRAGLARPSARTRTPPS